MVQTDDPVAAVDNFRINLRRVMEDRGISQRELASLAGRAYPFVNRLLMGKADNTSIVICEELAKAVGYPLEKMLVDPRKFR